MTLISKFVILSLFVTLFYFIGLLTFITDYEENKCEMTYMFEYPQFVKIKMYNQELFPRYGLYVYSEGKLTEKARAMKFEGIPVLFVPGNAGSFKQVRSLASVALRKALNSRIGFHFDFFTLNLNGELSGLNGAVLNDQTNFLNQSLYRILDLYDRKKSGDGPNSVVVIGHSMGGVISQSLLKSDIVNLLITLASPHARPSVSLDYFTANYYEQLATLNFSDQNKTLITIGGGFQDHLVNSWLTNSNISSLNVITTAIPKVWLSTDHACITWCKQLILTIIRALFDSVDLKTRQISLDPKYRTLVFKHHLLQNSGTNIRWAERYKIIVRLNDRGEWKEESRKQFSINLPQGTQNNQWHMIRINDNLKQQLLFVQTNNLAVTDWIFACEANKVRGNVNYCDSGIHLSQLSKIAPSTKIKRRTHLVNLITLKKRFPKITHVVVRILPTPEPVSVDFDLHNPSERLINVQLPRWFSLSRNTILSKTRLGASRYELNLNGLQHIIQSYFLYVEPIDCTEKVHHATAVLKVPWANHDSQVFITESLRKPLSVRLHGSRPSQHNNSTVKVQLTLDPKCQYSISVRNSIFGMLGQFARFYSPLLVANIAAVILMSFRSQLNSLEENKYCSLFQSSLSMSTKPYYLVTSVKLLSKILAMVKISFLPAPDTQILMDENMDFLILPLLLYVTSVGLTYLMTVALWVGIIMNESTLHKFFGKAFSRTFGKSFRMSDWLIKALHRVPCIVAATLFCLGLTTCGGLALCLGVCYYFHKLSQLGEDFVEGLIYRHVKKVAVELLKSLFTKIGKIFGKLVLQRFTKTASKDSSKENELITIGNKNETNEQIAGEQITDKKQNQSNKKTSQNNIDLVTKNEQIKTKKEDLNKNDDASETNDSQSKKETNENGETNENLSEGETNENEETNENLSEEEDDSGKSQPTNKINEQILENTNALRLRKMRANNETSVINEETINEQNKKESEIRKTVQQMFEAPDNSEMHFHFTLFLMWFIVAALNVPSVLTWAHNFKYNNILSPDPSKLFGILMCACAIPLWQFELPKPNKKFYKELGMVVYVLAIIALIYAPFSLYRLSYIISFTYIITLIHQFFAPSYPENETGEDDTINPIALIKEIKTKLE